MTDEERWFPVLDRLNKSIHKLGVARLDFLPFVGSDAGVQARELFDAAYKVERAWAAHLELCKRESNRERRAKLGNQAGT